MADVQAWVDGSAENYGWVLLGDEANSASAKRFAAREAGTAADRPALTITYRDTGTSTEDDALPTTVRLAPAYPNPFNPQTVLTYTVAQAGPVTLRVYDTLGRPVATLIDAVRPAGTHTVRFQAGTLPSGLYLARLTAAGTTQTRTLTLLR